MAPAVFLDDSDREILSLQLRPKRIMVADCGYSTEEVSNATPPKANLFRHRSMFSNYLRKSAMYILSPVDVILIRRIP
jgi:hypothetical protein